MFAELVPSVRGLVRNPGFALPAIVTLALGIGIGTAVFSVVNGVLLQPLRFHDPDRIVSLATSNSRGRARESPRMTGGDFAAVRSANKVFDAISVYYGGEMGVQVAGGAEFTGIDMVNPEFFRIFSQNVPAPGDSGAIVSAGFAARHFGGAGRAIGKVIGVENRAYAIAGVIEGSRFPATTDIWLPAPYVPENLNHTSYNYRAVAKLRAGVSLRQAQANLDAISAALAASSPSTNRGRRIVAVELRDQLTGPVRAMLYVLLGAVLMVLLIACANVSNLLLARAAARTREIAVRTALGASRARIVRMLVIESAALALFAGIPGIGFAALLSRVLLRVAPSNLPRAGDIHIDFAVLAFALAISLLSALIFGLLPAFHGSRSELSSRGALGARSNALRNSLVVLEVALSVVLAIGAGLFFRSLLALDSAAMGFEPDGILVMYAHAPAKTLAEYVNAGRFFTDRLVPALSRLPGVRSSAAVMGLPAGQYGSNGSYAVLGKQVYGEGRNMPESNWALATPNYFRTMRIPLFRGRDFSALDDYGAPGVIIVSQSVVRQLFPGENPLGHQIVCGLDQVSMKAMTIVGVVGDVRQDSPGSPPGPALYMPVEQHPFYANELQVLLRTAGPPSGLANAARTVAHTLHPDMAVKFTTMEEMISDSIAAPRFRSFLALAFAALALALAVAGIYGVLSYLVSRRTSELGLRMALGAQARDVIWLVLSRAALFATAGVVVGSGLSLALSRLIASMLFDMKATDPSTWAAVVPIVGIISILAAAGPAWRASRIDPIAALREQ